MLINKNLISIGIGEHQAGRSSGCFVCFTRQLNALSFQLALYLAHVSKRFVFGSSLIPSWIKSQYVVLEHPLKESDYMFVVF